MSFYRKHRPQKFADLVGQDHIRQTLTNALAGQSFAHAYLFAGPKGIGKTTAARLLAKAINCQGRPLAKESFEPCNRCRSCKEISAGSSLDMIEIDAASNRGIDEIRALREKIRFAPHGGKFKVYVIDECHMLTKEAFNALLKTLEEPPAHAIFVLATTEMYRLPATIISRTQVFDFNKAGQEEILKLLKKVVRLEGINVEEEALQLISRLSYGAFRDALSMLEQVASSSIDGRKTITLEQVQIILGQATEAAVWEFCQLLAKGDRRGALKLIEKIYFEGKDLENFIAETISVFRKLLFLKTGLAKEIEASSDEKVVLENLCRLFSVEEIVKVIEKLSSVISKVKTAILGQLPLELAVVEITKEQNQNAKIKNQNAFRHSNVKIKEEEYQKIQKKPPSAISETTNWWPSVFREVKAHNNALAAILKGAEFSGTDDGVIILKVKFKFHAEQITAKKNLAVIEAAIAKITGAAYKVECVVDPKLQIQKPLDSDEELLNNAKEVFEVE